ncbi:ribosome biogenesis GTPase A [Candidatus Gastranaerophilus sp. (ex Termes propinquus)]|nr:ribosome biogenesis GTPase A [Candidatus Gastranaerophilus sp. (ex Termes propinquus)]
MPPSDNIHWYPGHIAKAERALKEKLSLVDVILEVLDARLPVSSAYKNVDLLCPNKPRLILLNKVDLADAYEVKVWKKIIEEKTGRPVLLTSNKSQKDVNAIINKILELSKPVFIGLMKKQLLPRTMRTMVIGMPNVGKSSIINRLVNKSKTKTGAKAGVTRQQQWVRVHSKIDLLDTPGIIPSVQNDREVSFKLAFVNSIGEKAYDNEETARELLRFLQKRHLRHVREYYRLDGDISLENIALARNWLVSGGLPDIVRAAAYVLLNFREGRLGGITLDELPE